MQEACGSQIMNNPNNEEDKKKETLGESLKLKARDSAEKPRSVQKQNNEYWIMKEHHFHYEIHRDLDR